LVKAKRQQRRRPTPAEREPAIHNDAAGPAPRSGLDLWLALAVAAAAFLLYAPSLDNGFVDLDDPIYLTGNPHVLGGLTGENVRWAFTTTSAANWLPLTWLSHMLAVDLFGPNPAAPHHAINALLHATTAATVFLFFALATGARWRALAAAALFAFHPLRVESVTWVTERKDVLCGAFFGLSLLAYLSYCRRPRVGAYLLLLLWYALGLLSKTMIVTLPCVLVLLDYWPLHRLRVGRSEPAPVAGDGNNEAPAFPTRPAFWLALEKLPLLLMAVASSLATVVFQREGEAMAPAAHLTLGDRAANALVSVVRYVGKTFWPTDLAVLYPHPGHWPVWAVVASAAVVLGVSVVALLLVRRRPYVAVGWFWFVGMLVPVIGIIQVGDQAMADRYTYLPSIGLMVALVWWVADFAGRRPAFHAALGPALGVVLAVLAVLTVLQQRYWRDTVALATHAIDSDPDNWAARGLLATRLMSTDPQAGLAQFLSSARGMSQVGRASDAAELCRLLAQRFPNRPEIHAEWGHALLTLGRRDEAAARFREALRLAPDNAPLRKAVEAELRLAGGTP
jgi:hypothetical protein